jgi:hypothetical protein
VFSTPRVPSPFIEDSSQDYTVREGPASCVSQAPLRDYFSLQVARTEAGPFHRGFIAAGQDEDGSAPQSHLSHGAGCWALRSGVQLLFSPRAFPGRRALL